MRRALLPASLVLLAGCQQPGPAVARPYAAAEEGLTLVYINPSLPQEQQAAKRLQVRVDKVVARPDGATVVFKTFTVGLEKPFQALFVLKDGGVGLLSPDGKNEAVMLPKGFPETDAWTSGPSSFRVLGRGSWGRGAAVLPEDRAMDGSWVEARAEGAKPVRSLYLPGLGEVETDELQPDGRWVTVNLLTQFGFTDMPSAAPMAPAEAPAHKRSAKRKR
ncbi:MAG TPA: hypothetical protein VL181_06575 [Holophagaceae bacterium]|nr:hypothetical protein [Holophagaceae bacterium]